MSSAYAKYPARYLFVPRSSARINTGRGCPLLPVIFVSPRYAAVRCIAAGCAVYVLSAVLDIGGDNAMNCYRQGLCASVNCAAYCRLYAVYVLSAVLDIGGDNAIYRRRRGYVRMQNVQHIAVGCAVYVPSAVLDIGGDNAMNCYRQGLCASVNCAAYCRRYAVYVPSAVPDTAGDNAIYRCRRGSFFLPTMQFIRRRSCSIFAVSCA